MKIVYSTFGLSTAALLSSLWSAPVYAHPPGSWNICDSVNDPICKDGDNTISDATLSSSVQSASTALSTATAGTSGPLDNIIVDPGANITWTNANSLLLSAGDNISQNGTFTAATGSLNLSVSQFPYGLGGILDYNVATTGVGTTTVTGGAGSDTFNLNAAFHGSISGGGGMDTLNINTTAPTITMDSIENLNLGNSASNSGSYTVKTGNTITTDTINVGLSGSGTLALQNGGQVTSTNEYVAHNTGSNGTFDQSGGTNTVTNLTIGASSGGTATYNISGGTLQAANVVLNPSGKFNSEGGTLVANNFTNGGTLTSGGTPVTTNITGNYIQLLNGTYEADIMGLLQGTEYDWLDVDGMATLAGNLDVNLLDLGNGFNPSLGDTFDLLSADTIFGRFDSLELPTLINGLTWNLNYIYDDVGADYVRLSVVERSVPEPSSLLLMSIGLAGLGFVSRKKKAH